MRRGLDDPATTGRVLDEERGLLRVPVRHLLALANPLDGDTWNIGRRITPADVRDHRDDSPLSGTGHRCTGGEVGRHCVGCEIVRIAYLVEHGWPPAQEDPHPITVDVGLWGYVPDWPILDGNHRVAAAVIRGDEFIDVAVQGDWYLAVSLLVDGAPHRSGHRHQVGTTVGSR